jgi:hypothetical protein
MTALTAAETAKALRHLADRIEADPGIPPLSSHWPLVFQTLGVLGAEELEAIGRSLGVEDSHLSEAVQEEGGFGWHKLRGRAGGVLVEVTADAGPLLHPLPTEGGIRRTYVGMTP